MRDLDSSNITQAVLDRFAGTPSPRLREILASLVQHLHAFARETRLSEAEWEAGIRFLTETGHKCEGGRQEFILLSDVLGLSMLVTALHHTKPAGCTEATVLGPFFVEDAPAYAHGGDIANGAAGEPCIVTGSVRGPDGEAVPGATIQVWQSDSEGMYDVQRPSLAQAQGRGVLRSGPEGEFHFRTVLAQAYPIPHDGPVGVLLQATARHPWRPAHLHFMIDAPGYQKLVTHIFRDGDQWLDSDPVFGVRESLVAPWTEGEDGIWRLDYPFILNRAGAA